MEEAVRYAFNVEWSDPQTGVEWSYKLLHWPATREIELVDSKGRLFLRRTVLTDLATEQLVLGAVVTVYARQLRLTGYADTYTAEAFRNRVERTLGLIKADGMGCMGEILASISAAGLQISCLRMCQLSIQEAEQFYAVHWQQPFFPTLTRFVSSGPVLAMELVGQGAVSVWRALLGPTNSNLARQQAPGSIRARFGTDNTFNACHGSDSPTTAVRELSFFFGASNLGAGGGSVPRPLPGRLQPLLEGTTACVIKPHAVRDGHAGAIIGELQQHGFRITAAETFCLDRQQATQFHEVYRSVVAPAEFEGMVSELCSGTCLALEVALADGSGEPALELLRTLCGPADPELARAVRPASIRACFGSRNGAAGRNAVHCTDLEGDTQLEVAFFFICSDW